MIAVDSNVLAESLLSAPLTTAAEILCQSDPAWVARVLRREPDRVFCTGARGIGTAYLMPWVGLCGVQPRVR